jgi:hypothetical protein
VTISWDLMPKGILKSETSCKKKTFYFPHQSLNRRSKAPMFHDYGIIRRWRGGTIKFDFFFRYRLSFYLHFMIKEKTEQHGTRTRQIA